MGERLDVVDQRRMRVVSSGANRPRGRLPTELGGARKESLLVRCEEAGQGWLAFIRSASPRRDERTQRNGPASVVIRGHRVYAKTSPRPLRTRHRRARWLNRCGCVRRTRPRGLTPDRVRCSREPRTGCRGRNRALRCADRLSHPPQDGEKRRGAVRRRSGRTLTMTAGSWVDHEHRGGAAHSSGA